MKSREFQTGTSPPTLPKLDILLLHLSWGAYQMQNEVSCPPFIAGQQGEWTQEPLAASSAAGAERRDHTTNPTVGWRRCLHQSHPALQCLSQW